MVLKIFFYWINYEVVSTRINMGYEEIGAVLTQGERGQRVVRGAWDENEWKKIENNVKFADNMTITETIVLTYLYFRFFLSQMWLLKYYIHNVV